MKKTMQYKPAFSLMEMMVVLLIISIVAAATAPMISKKLARNAEQSDNPWVYPNLGNSIAYNLRGNNDATAIIGGVTVPDEAGHPRLYINGRSGIAFGENGSYNGSIRFVNGEINGSESRCIIIGKAGQPTDDNIIIGSLDDTIRPGQGASGIGKNTKPDGQESIAIGTGASAFGGSSIAIGVGADVNHADRDGNEAGSTTQDNGIAIGSSAVALEEGNIAIGHNAYADNVNSVAIGAGAATTADNQIVLGTSSQTVYIPGRLVVDGETVVNRNGGKFAFRPSYRYNNPNTDFGLFWIEGNDEHSPVGGKLVNFKDASPELTPDNISLSDRRLKNVGDKFTGGLEELKKLDLYNFTFKKDEKKTPHVGVMAQDLQKVFPNAVTEGEDGYLRIRWDEMFYAVINAVKELDTKITAVVEQVKAYTDKVNKLEETISAQQETITEQQKAISELKKNNADFEKRLAKLEKNLK